LMMGSEIVWSFGELDGSGDRLPHSFGTDRSASRWDIWRQVLWWDTSNIHRIGYCQILPLLVALATISPAKQTTIVPTVVRVNSSHPLLCA
jgi:hypothetical protein